MIILRKLRELGEFFEQHLFNQEELIFCQLKPCGLQNKLPFKFFSVNSESGCRTFKYGVFRAVRDVQSKTKWTLSHLRKIKGKGIRHLVISPAINSLISSFHFVDK